MKVLMVSSEAVPFCKTGGLADVVGALSAALVSLRIDVKILLPLHGSIDRSGMEDTGITAEARVCGKKEPVSFLTRKVGKVPYYFVNHPFFTRRSGVYGDTSFAPYADNLQRFTLLDKAAFALCRGLDWKPDIMHAHDWTSGFVPYLLEKSRDSFFRGTKSMMTIHNLAYQGDFSRLDFLKADIDADPRLFSGSGTERRCNLLGSGLAFASWITTVSPTYAREIRQEKYGCGLSGLLEERSSVLSGILNGIDYGEWNSESDEFLPFPFSADDLSGKKEMKRLIQKQFSLKEDDSVPLIAMISRIAEQKGFEELLEGEPCALERIVRDHKVQMIIIGTGDGKMERKLESLGGKYDNLSVNILFSNKFAHQCEAGADYFLMPSRFEPCGLNQLYSLHYGTIPIARKTGGLADSIIDVDSSPETGTGFLFTTEGGDEIVKVVERALSHYPALEEMRKRGMLTDFSWKNSALSYNSLYTMLEDGGKKE